MATKPPEIMPPEYYKRQRTWAIAIAGSIAALFLFSVYKVFSEANQRDVERNSRPPTAEQQAKRGYDTYVSRILKDPDSAEFRDKHRGKLVYGQIAMCGEVNAKNAFGGYVGYRRFIAFGDGTAEIDDGSVKEFSDDWIRFC